MKEADAILKACPLFLHIADTDLASMLTCLGAVKRSYGKQDFIFHAGQAASQVGIVLTGSVQIIKEDFFGNRSILGMAEPGQLFGEAFSCAEAEKLPVSVVAAEKTEVLFLDYRRIITTCPSACDFHTHLIQNMLGILARKNILLTQKIEHMTKRTTREKLLSYLSAQAVLAGSPSFSIPFNRQELADYLSVDRSAMSLELSRLQKEGLLTCRKNQFTLFTPDCS